MLVALIAVTVIALAAIVAVAEQSRRATREHARERNLMLNQLLHLAGRTWQQPPAGQPVADIDDIDHSLYAPSGMPDLYDDFGPES